MPLAAAGRKIQVWMKSNSSKNPINPFLRKAFYNVVWIEASMEGNSEIVDFFLEKYEELQANTRKHKEIHKIGRDPPEIHSVLVLAPALYLRHKTTFLDLVEGTPPI